MKYKIIADSACNLLPTDIHEDEVGFDVAPMSLTIGEENFKDDGTISPVDFLTKLKGFKGKTGSACPSPYEFMSRMEGAEYYIIITIASKMSGSYNAAMVAKRSVENPDNVFVIDSRLTGGTMELMIRKAIELAKQDVSFEEMQKQLTEYCLSMRFVFELVHYNNLVANGRVGKLIAMLAEKLKIKTICIAEDGKIELKEKLRSQSLVEKRLIHHVIKCNPDTDFKNKTCIISHTNNLAGAESIKKRLEEECDFKEIIIHENKLLCSYYAEQDGIMICY